MIRLATAYPRRGLGTKKEGVRPGDGVGVILQLLVKGDDMQHVQQLPLVFVEPLHLHIERRWDPA